MALLQDDFSQTAAYGSDPGSEEEEDDKEEALLQEREEAKQKLAELECASQALLAELLTLESEYEIEKSCRKQAEAYAAQVNRDNKELKRISKVFLPLLSPFPGDLMDLSKGSEVAPEAGSDPLSQYLQQIKDLQAKVSWLLEEKKELAMQVKALQEQLEEECSERLSLQTALEKTQRALQRVKQVSRLVTEEYGEVSRQLDLEQELRQHAEAFASQMLVKQKEANRQSRILIQNAGPDAQLLQALEDVAKMTRALEEARLEHQVKVEDLEAQLAGRPQLNEMHKLQAALALAQDEKACLEKRLAHSEERDALLEEKVKSLEEKVKLVEASPPELVPPPPPPPPPLPPPPCPGLVDPLSAIRQRKGARQAQPYNDVSTDDFKVKAMEEMMARIKSGVVLRTARQDTGALSKAQSATKRRSTVMELQGLLSTMKKPVRKSSRRKGSQKRTDNQLEALLQRRRRIVDSTGQPQPPQPSGAAAHSPPIQAPRAQAEPQKRNPPPSMQCSQDSSSPGGRAEAAVGRPQAGRRAVPPRVPQQL
ncbi:shootin-1-like [Tiliqua scincoides]|uniref:shootin-1-like n=1 Tax=Tiliqua scincoides TaxID=71010 RepID=UPI00346361E1